MRSISTLSSSSAGNSGLDGRLGTGLAIGGRSCRTMRGSSAILGNGLGVTGWPCAFFAQYPRPGSGTCNFLHVFPMATAETPYFDTSEVRGCSQTSSYSSSRFQSGGPKPLLVIFLYPGLIFAGNAE